MTSEADWQARVGRNWAESWALTDRSFGGLTQQLLDRLEHLPGDAILDVGCGAGELSLALARLRPRAEIVGVDISPDLVAAAGDRAGERPRLRFELANAATWQGDFSPDLVVSRHGVMFFGDPPAAFAHLRSIARPGARLAFTCFRDRRLNPWASELAALLPPEFAAPVDPTAPGPFAFADPDRVRGILEAGGWDVETVEPIDFAYVAGLGDDPVSDAVAFFSRIGPCAAALQSVCDGPVRDAFLARLRSWLEANRSGQIVAFPGAAWYVLARSG